MMMLIENPYGVFVRANACFLLLGECPYGALFPPQKLLDMEAFGIFASAKHERYYA